MMIFRVIRLIIYKVGVSLIGMPIVGRDNFTQESAKCQTFHSYYTIYEKTKLMESKRIYRELDDETKQKISAAMRGKQKTTNHKQNIANGMKRYWENVPHKEDTDFTSSGRIV